MANELTATQERFAALNREMLGMLAKVRAVAAEIGDMASGELCETEGVRTVEDELTGLEVMCADNIAAVGAR